VNRYVFYDKFWDKIIVSVGFPSICYLAFVVMTEETEEGFTCGQYLFEHVEFVGVL
jgi:hypothetical protein